MIEVRRRSCFSGLQANPGHHMPTARARQVAPQPCCSPTGQCRPPSLPQIPGCLTRVEADKFIAAAEASGFTHQSSRGPAFGEVS